MTKIEELAALIADNERIITKLEEHFNADFRERCPNCLEKGWCWRGTVPTSCKCLECERADLQELMEIPERNHLSRWERCIAAKMYSGIKPCELLILNPEQLPDMVRQQRQSLLKDISV